MVAKEGEGRNDYRISLASDTDSFLGKESVKARIRRRISDTFLLFSFLSPPLILL
jgi:hypothetical protein